MRRGPTLVVVLVAACAAAQASVSDPLARGDAAWAERDRGARDGRPRAEPIDAAVRAYEAALSEAPRDLEAHWKLLRALHFEGDFVRSDPTSRRPVFERAREVSLRGLRILDDRLGPDVDVGSLEPDEVARRVAEAEDVSSGEAARLYFWSAIGWAAWSRDAGLLDAVRRGAANRIHRYARVAIALDPAIEEGGAFRLLGRLHAELPRVPFVTGWVDRDRALPLVERGREIAPDHPGNRLLLALTILDLAPDRRDEAEALLRQVAGLEPREGSRIEDLAIRDAARERLASL